MTTHSFQPARYLQPTLYGNAAFSFSSGMLLLILSGWLPSFMGTGVPWFYRISGVLLMLYGAFVYSMTARPTLARSFVRLVIVADGLWVFGSVFILLADPFGLSVAGKWAVLIIGDMVLTFAITQFLGQRHPR